MRTRMQMRMRMPMPMPMQGVQCQRCQRRKPLAPPAPAVSLCSVDVAHMTLYRGDHTRVLGAPEGGAER